MKGRGEEAEEGREEELAANVWATERAARARSEQDRGLAWTLALLGKGGSVRVRRRERTGVAIHDLVALCILLERVGSPLPSPSLGQPSERFGRSVSVSGAFIIRLEEDTDGMYSSSTLCGVVGVGGWAESVAGCPCDALGVGPGWAVSCGRDEGSTGLAGSGAEGAERE